jgi:hypothetical protein
MTKRHFLEAAMRRGYARVYVYGETLPRLLSWDLGMPVELNSMGIKMTVIQNDLPTEIEIPWDSISSMVAQDSERYPEDLNE